METKDVWWVLLLVIKDPCMENDNYEESQKFLMSEATDERKPYIYFISAFILFTSFEQNI